MVHFEFATSCTEPVLVLSRECGTLQEQWDEIESFLRCLNLFGRKGICRIDNRSLCNVPDLLLLAYCSYLGFIRSCLSFRSRHVVRHDNLQNTYEIFRKETWWYRRHPLDVFWVCVSASFFIPATVIRNDIFICNTRQARNIPYWTRYHEQRKPNRK